MTPTITIGVAPRFDFLGKTWTMGADGALQKKCGFPREWIFDVVPWPSPSALWGILRECAATGNAVVLLGYPLAPLTLCERSVDTLSTVAASWVSLDIDAEHHDSLTPEQARDALPGPFQRCACYWQRTGSHGVKRGSRLRLFFALDEPTLPDVWRDYFASDTLGVDASMFRATQVNYMAPPRFVGMVDPVPPSERDGVLSGVPYVKVSPVLAAVAKMRRRKATRRPVLGTDTAALLRYYASAAAGCIEDVKDAPSGERQNTLVRKAAKITGLAIGAGIDPEPELEQLRETALAQRPNDADEIDRALGWVARRVTDPIYPGDREQ